MEPFCPVERKRLGNFGKRPYKEHLCEIYFEFVPVLRGEVSFKGVLSILTLVAILFGGVELFGQFWYQTLLETFFLIGPGV